MSLVVVDASAFGPILVPDEASDMIPGLVEILTQARAVAPQHWPLETGNLLSMAVRRNRLKAAQLPGLVALLQDASVEIDAETTSAAWTSVLDMANRHQLTTYDAAYLELACRRKIALATLDTDLIRAARAENIEVMTR